MKDDIITFEQDNEYDYDKIFINNILHICLDINIKYNLVSWIEDSNPNKRMYCIRLFTKKIEIILEYEKEDNWKKILEILNEVL
jgi:pantothenate kinase